MLVLERVKHDLYPFIDATQNLTNCAKGKTVLVTGGSKGIGKSIAKHFSLAGASRVIISGRTAPALEEAKSAIENTTSGCDVVTVEADMTDVHSVQRLYEGLPSVPHVVVNNVGATQCQAKMVDGDPETWWKDYEINVKSCYLSSRAYLRALTGRPGVILNVSSSVSTTTNEGLSSYASAKTAVNRLTEFINAEHSAQGVHCVAFHPGGILDTGMGQNAPDYFKPYLFDTLDLAGGTAVYLSTPRASFLDGRFVFANYDMEKLETLKESILSEDLLKQKVVFGDQLRSAVVPPSK